MSRRNFGIRCFGGQRHGHTDLGACGDGIGVPRGIAMACMALWSEDKLRATSRWRADVGTPRGAVRNFVRILLALHDLRESLAGQCLPTVPNIASRSPTNNFSSQMAQSDSRPDSSSDISFAETDAAPNNLVLSVTAVRPRSGLAKRRSKTAKLSIIAAPIVQNPVAVFPGLTSRICSF